MLCNKEQRVEERKREDRGREERRGAEHRHQLERAENSQLILFQFHQLLGETAAEVDELEHFPSGLKPASFHAPKSGEERKVESRRC